MNLRTDKHKDNHMHSRDNNNSQPFKGADTTFCGLYVGQHVVCIDNENFLIDSPVVEGQELEKNRVYTISAISTDYIDVAVQIAEHPFLVAVDGWYGHWRFRPLQKLRAVAGEQDAGEAA